MSFLNSYIPSNVKSRTVQNVTQWYGLNRKRTIDSGELAECENISTKKQPFLYTERVGKKSTKITIPDTFTDTGIKINSIFTYDNVMIVILMCYNVPAIAPVPSYYLRVLYYKLDDTPSYKGYSAISGLTVDDYNNNKPRSVTRFNLYSGASPVSSTYVRKLLIFPEAYSMDYTPTISGAGTFPVAAINLCPKLTYVTAYGGRLFGVKDGKVYASAYNNYADWTLDTATDMASSHAWVSATQTNTKADAEFTGITVYDGHVMPFKRNLLHQIYNTKNPFRITDVGDKGAVNNLAHCVYNNVLYYIADDGVYAYTGGTPTKISEKLNIEDYGGSVICANDEVVYCFIPSFGIATYCTDNGTWGRLSKSSKDGGTAITIGTPISMAVSDGVIYLASNDSGTYRIHEIRQGEFGAFSFSTYVNYGGEIAERSIRKIRLIAEYRTSGTVNIGYGNATKSYTLTIGASCSSAEKVLTFLVPKSAGFRHQITISGTGDVTFKYMTVEYESGQESDITLLSNEVTT